MTSFFSRRTAIVLGGLAAINLAISVFVQWKIFVTLGPGLQTDAYYAAQALPLVLISIFGAALGRVLVPLLIETPDNEKASSIWFTLLFSTVVFGILAFILYSLSPLLITVLFPGFIQAEQALSIALLQILSFSLLFSGTSAVLGKNVGDDLREGKVTLPILLAYRRGTDDERIFWKQTIEDHVKFGVTSLVQPGMP